jgi:hypothetical protein
MSPVHRPKTEMVSNTRNQGSTERTDHILVSRSPNAILSRSFAQSNQEPAAMLGMTDRSHSPSLVSQEMLSTLKFKGDRAKMPNLTTFDQIRKYTG